jgi:RNA polymerase sigma-70 factor (ECF subfamily)
MLNNTQTDQQLWNAIVDDDFRAFNVLFKRYWKKLFMTAYTFLKDKDACEEIIQDIFVYLWNNRRRLAIESFPKYLATTTRHKVYNYLRSVKSSHITYVEDLNDTSEGFCINQGDENIRQHELDQQLHSYLDLLPNRCKEIFVMSRLEHFSNEEIAARLHISKRTVENQVTTALKKLRVSLKSSVLIFLLLTFFFR